MPTPLARSGQLCTGEITINISSNNLFLQALQTLVLATYLMLPDSDLRI